jgi:hypothetical protein
MAEATDTIEALQAEVAVLRQKLAIRNNHSLERLKAYVAANPDRIAEQSAARVARWLEKNRDNYNARRRERRRLAREAAAQGQTDTVVKPPV